MFSTKIAQRILTGTTMLGCMYTIDQSEPTPLEKKVAQTVVCHVNTKNNFDNVRNLCKNQPAGFILYNWANDINTCKEATELTEAIKKIAKGTIILAVDEEGGRVNRIKELQTMCQESRAKEYPKKSQLYDSYHELAKELRQVGINVNLAPVVDVNSNPDNPAIANRSFSDSAFRVAECAEQAIQAFLDAQILPCIKHYPGHGDTKEDSHKTLARVNKNRNELEDTELVPYKYLSNKTPMIMTAHIMTALDRDYCATLSKKTLDYLRNEYNFRGVIVADSLTMKGVLMNANPQDKNCDEISPEQIAKAGILALKSGCDLLLLGGREINDCNPTRELSPDQIHKIIKIMASEIESQGLYQEIDRAHENVQQLMKKIAP